jgi:hypothetical protein
VSSTGQPGDLGEQIDKLALKVDAAMRGLHLAGQQQNEFRAEIAERFARVGSQMKALAGSAGGERTVEWTTVQDHDAAAQVLIDLYDWVYSVWVHHEPDILRSGCWMYHPAALEHLRSLRATWEDAMASPGKPEKYTTWIGPLRDKGQERIKELTAGCRGGAHKPLNGAGSNAEWLVCLGETRADIEETLTEIAAWWVESRGSRNAPTAPGLQLKVRAA